MSSPSRPERLSGEDLTFWWLDSPMQPTTMAMLMILDRAPDPEWVRLAFERAVDAVPRLAQRVADAPLDITLPHWERDPTFDLDFHVRRHVLAGAADLNELFREITPVYEAAFDRSRPLWEARIYDGLGDEKRSALFFKLHHAVADGVGGNAIFAAMTDWQRTPDVSSCPISHRPEKHGWGEAVGLGRQILEAVEDRIVLDIDRIRAAASTVRDAVEHPERIKRLVDAVGSMIATATFDSQSPLKSGAGRARRMTGMALPFDEVRAVKRALGGTMIDVILTVMARAIGQWHVQHRLELVEELMTLVPVNLRKPEEWTEQAHVGNVTTGILVPLPIRLRSAMSTYREIQKRMAEKKADPASNAAPVLSELMSLLPRRLFTWFAEATFGGVDFIVTNVPGILVTRYMAGAEIVAAYPFAPVAMRSPVSVALYGYRESLYIGINSDEMLMPDATAFQAEIVAAFNDLKRAAHRRGGGVGAN